MDDLRLLREGLISLLAEQDDIIVIGAAASGTTALAKIKELRPEVALIDIGMPGKDGITVTQALHREAPEVKVIILGMPDLTDEIMACIEAGAAGYVLKEASFYLGWEPARIGKHYRLPSFGGAFNHIVKHLRGRACLSAVSGRGIRA